MTALPPWADDLARQFRTGLPPDGYAVITDRWVTSQDEIDTLRRFGLKVALVRCRLTFPPTDCNVFIDCLFDTIAKR